MSTLSKTIQDATRKRWRTAYGEFPASDGLEWYPKTRIEFREKLMLDPQYWLSTCCEIADRRGTGYIPFEHNSAQRRYDNEITFAGVVRDANAKVRKWGLTTKRLGNGLQSSVYSSGRDGLAVAQNEAAAKELAKTVTTLYESAWQYFKDLGQDPAFYLPRVTSDTVYGLVFGDIGSQYMAGWSGARGLGRLVVVHDLYITELAEWEGDVERSVTGLLTACPPDAEGLRQTVDWNAHTNWMGTEAYNVWECARKDRSDPEWNGFTPFFVGTGDLPEYYTPEFLADQARAMDAKQFKLNYPRVIEDLYTQNEMCVFDSDHIRDCTRADYAGRCERYLHGIDTAEGVPDGDWSVCITLGWTGECWQEACPPLWERVDAHIFADMLDQRVREYPGTCVVERNVGSAVIALLREKGTPHLYKHKARDKDGKQVRRVGFPVGTNKRIMISDLQQMLREGRIRLVTKRLIDELLIFEHKPHDQRIAAAPDRKGAHDDGPMALMNGVQGESYTFGVGPLVQYR